MKCSVREVMIEDSEKIMEMISEVREKDGSFEGMKVLEGCNSFFDVMSQCLYLKSDSVSKYLSKQYIYFVFDEEDFLLGCIQIRPDNVDSLLEYAGHIGYAIRPSRRGEGNGKLLLQQALSLCKNLYQLNRVLITCREENLLSSKVIEKCGGVLENIVFINKEQCHYKRYWIDLKVGQV